MNMTRFNEMLHGSLDLAQSHLEADTPDLSETQCALINAIRHIRQLESQVERLQNNVARLCDAEGSLD